MKSGMKGQLQTKVPSEHTHISTLSSLSRGQEGSSFFLTINSLASHLRVTVLTPTGLAWRCFLIQFQWTSCLKYIEGEEGRQCTGITRTISSWNSHVDKSLERMKRHISTMQWSTDTWANASQSNPRTGTSTALPLISSMDVRGSNYYLQYDTISWWLTFSCS